MLELSTDEADCSAIEFNTDGAEAGEAQVGGSGNGSTDDCSELRAMNDASLIAARCTTEPTQKLSEIQQKLAQMEVRSQQLTEQLKRIGSQPGLVDPVVTMTTQTRQIRIVGYGWPALSRLLQRLLATSPSQ